MSSRIFLPHCSTFLIQRNNNIIRNYTPPHTPSRVDRNTEQESLIFIEGKFEWHESIVYVQETVINGLNKVSEFFL